MSFLYYPQLNKLARFDDGLTEVYFFQSEDSHNTYEVIWNKFTESHHTKFAEITKNTVTLFHNNEVHKADSHAEADFWVTAQFEKFHDEQFPKGFHFKIPHEARITTTIAYFGDMQVGSFHIYAKENIAWVEFSMRVPGYNNDYDHCNKFYFDEKHYYKGNPHPLCVQFEATGLVLSTGLEGEELAANKQNTIKILKAIRLEVSNAFDFERYEKDKKAAKQAKIKELSTTANFLGLPTLKGTIKQQVWAEKIRAEFLEQCTEKAAQKTKRIKTAKYWIDNRSNLNEKLEK